MTAELICDIFGESSKVYSEEDAKVTQAFVRGNKFFFRILE